MEEFKNSKLRKLKPEGLISDSPSTSGQELDLFFLSLAMVFNDLKGLVYFDKWRERYYRKPQPTEYSEHAGEFAGLKIQTLKYTIGLLHESLLLISENRKIIDSTIFQRYYQQLNSNDQKIWSLLIDICDDKETKEYNEVDIEKIRHLLLMIRNNVAFHFFQSGKPLAQGFRRHFFEQDLGDLTKFATYSSTSTGFYETRYYYADAAVSGFLAEQTDETGRKVLDDIYMLTVQLAKVINALLEQYHRDKSKA